MRRLRGFQKGETGSNRPGIKFQDDVERVLKSFEREWPGFRSYRIPDGLSVVRSGSKIVDIRGKHPTPADFGMIFPGGRGGLLEAKSVKGELLSFGKSGLKELQRECLEEWCQEPTNALTYLIVEVLKPGLEGVYLLYGKTFAGIEQRNEKSITVSEIMQHGIKLGPPIYWRAENMLAEFRKEMNNENRNKSNCNYER